MAAAAKPLRDITTAHYRNKRVQGCSTAEHRALKVPEDSYPVTIGLHVSPTGACTNAPKPGSFPKSRHQRSGMGAESTSLTQQAYGRVRLKRSAMHCIPRWARNSFLGHFSNPIRFSRRPKPMGRPPNLERHVATSPRSSSLLHMACKHSCCTPSIALVRCPRKTAPSKRDAAQQSSIDRDG